MQASVDPLTSVSENRSCAATAELTAVPDWDHEQAGSLGRGLIVAGSAGVAPPSRPGTAASRRSVIIGRVSVDFSRLLYHYPIRQRSVNGTMPGIGGSRRPYSRGGATIAISGRRHRTRTADVVESVPVASAISGSTPNDPNVVARSVALLDDATGGARRRSHRPRPVARLRHGEAFARMPRRQASMISRNTARSNGICLSVAHEIPSAPRAVIPGEPGKHATLPAAWAFLVCATRQAAGAVVSWPLASAEQCPQERSGR